MGKGIKVGLFALSTALAISLGLNAYSLWLIEDIESRLPTSVEDLDWRYPGYVDDVETAKTKIDALEERADDLESKVRNLPLY